MKNPHDTLFKRAMGNPDNTRIFLRENLPERILGKLEFSTLKNARESFADQDFRDHFADLVFEVDVESSLRPGLICLLLEHKTSPAPQTSLQLLRYMVNVWYQKYAEGKIPLVLPVVFYHGEREWTAARRISDMLDTDVSWVEENFPDYEYLLFTLEDLADVVEGISLPELKAYVQALKTAQAKEDREKYYLRLDVLISIVREFAEDDWLWETVGRVSLTYAIVNSPKGEAQKVANKLTKKIPERRGDIVSAVEEFKKEGLVEGIEIGKKRALLESARTLLEQRLDEPISDDLEERLENSDYATLKLIVDRIFDIETEKDVKELLV